MPLIYWGEVVSCQRDDCQNQGLQDWKICQMINLLQLRLSFTQLHAVGDWVHAQVITA